MNLLAAAAPAAAAAEDIRDIRAPLHIPEWWRWPLAIALAAIVAFAVIVLVRYWRKRHALVLTPRERALEALRIAEEHAHAGRSREWGDLVSGALRGALAARLGADVLPQTTSELAKTELAAPVLKDWPSIIGLLETCDLTRFARASLVVDALLTHTAAVRDLVEHLYPADVTS